MTRPWNYVKLLRKANILSHFKTRWKHIALFSPNFSPELSLWRAHDRHGWGIKLPSIRESRVPLPTQRPGLPQKRHQGRHGHPEGLAAGAQEEPVPDKGGEDHAGHYHQDDPDAGLYMVRQRQAEAQEGEQDDLGAQE